MKRFISFLFITLYLSGTNAQIPFREIDKWGLVDNLSLELISEIKYDEIYSRNIFSELYNFRIGDKFGCLNYKGEEILPAIYDEISPFYYEIAKVRIGDRQFIINEKGKEIIDKEYKVHPWAGQEEAEEDKTISTDFKLIEFPIDKWGDIHKQLNPDSIWTYENIKRFNPYMKNGKWGVISSFKYDTGAIFDSIVYYGKSSLYLKQGEKVGLLISKIGGQAPKLFLDDFDELIIEQKHNNSYAYFFRKENLWGYLDVRDNLITPRYKSIAFVKHDYRLLEVVTQNEKKGFVDFVRSRELFSEERLKSQSELKELFAPIEQSANKLLEQKIGKNLKNFEKRVDDIFEKNAKIVNKSVDELMKEFAINPYDVRNTFSKETVEKIGTWMLENDIINLKNSNCHPALISVCDSLYRKNNDLVNKEYAYQTSIILETFKSKHIKSLSPGLINAALLNFNKKSDFENLFNKRIFFLFHFYNAIYFDLIDRGLISKPPRK